MAHAAGALRVSAAGLARRLGGVWCCYHVANSYATNASATPHNKNNTVILDMDGGGGKSVMARR